MSQVAGGLGGETPHMISAAMKGLARLAYEFSDLVSAACNLLPSTFLLLQRKNREIIKVSSSFLPCVLSILTFSLGLFILSFTAGQFGIFKGFGGQIKS